MRKFLVLAILPCFIISSAANAAIKPRGGSADSRVKHVIFQDQNVVKVQGHYGYSTLIEFDKDEAIITVSLGDSIAWQTTTTNNNLLFIKPLQPNADTNMTVVTTQRIYSFELEADQASSADAKELTYRLKFVYPEKEAEMLARVGKGKLARYAHASDKTNPSDWNFKYSFSGSKAIRPIKTFDNGKFTYFEFSEHSRTPAIFAVDEKGNELLLNHHKEGDYIVVKRLSAQFTLRDGESVTCIFNEGFPMEDFAEAHLAPVPKKKPQPNFIERFFSKLEGATNE